MSSAWLIEKRGSYQWVTVRRGRFDWTADSLEAIRFKRQEDAEKTMLFTQMHLGESFTTEHGWADMPPKEAK